MITLRQLARKLNLRVLGEGDPVIAGLSEDSRLIKPGFIFAAVKGKHLDGREYISPAIKNGAAALLVSGEDIEADVPRLLVDDSQMRSTMTRLAAKIYKHPGQSLTLLALTGTNGKTTTSYLLESILDRAGMNPGVFGTITWRGPGLDVPAINTTPEGPALQANLAKLVDQGSKAVVIEVSSHALSLGRVAQLDFDLALFTNLSQDHLDFHQDMEGYYQAKKLLFTGHLKPGKSLPQAIVNIDDPWGGRLAGELGDVLGFGFRIDAQVRGRNLTLGRNGLTFEVEADFEAGGKRRRFSWKQRSPLLGRFNAYNLLGTIAMALALGFEEYTIRPALEAATGAPGRLERVGANDDFLVLVDYAHSPEAISQALTVLRGLSPQRLFIVFGCGGDRDRTKRPLMAEAAARGSDFVILTSDNPRTEEPLAILNDAEPGLATAGLKKVAPDSLNAEDLPDRAYAVIADRRAAIDLAVRLMTPGDILLIAGKGHEDYQIIGYDKVHFDDREEALKTLAELGHA